jgi:type I restriction enzyme, S subunit
VSSGKIDERRSRSAGHPKVAVQAEWRLQRLGEVCEIIMGTSPPGDTYNNVGEGTPLVNGPVEFSRGSFGKTVRSKFTTAPNKVCKTDDLIVCVRGSTTGRTNIAAFDACIGRGVAAIRARDCQPWINYFIRYKRDAIYRLGTGATFPNISAAALADLKVLMPPLPEQRRIVGILDEAFAGIATAKANTEKNFENARALFESHLQAVFTKGGAGWTERRFGELATFRNGINFTKSSRGDSVKIVGVKDFQSSFWAPLDKLDTVTTDGLLPDGDMLKENDVLFVRSNGNVELIGRCLLVGAIAERIAHSGFTIRARLSGGEVMPKYLCHFLKANNTRRKMIDSGIGTNIKSLNQATLSALVVPVPPYDQQTSIVNKLEALDAETQRLTSLYGRKLTALDDLKKSLLHQAFSGDL